MTRSCWSLFKEIPMLCLVGLCCKGCNNMLQHSFGHKHHLCNLGCHPLVYYFQNLEFVSRSNLTLLTICLLRAGEQIQGAMNPLRGLYH